jgi:hypothetical protein
MTKNLLEPDYQETYDLWKGDPSPANAGSLLKSVDPIISTALRSYGGPSQGSPNLRSQARQLSLDAFETYDPIRGSMKSHLMSQLQTLRRLSTQEQQIIGLPEQVSLDQYRTNIASKELEDRLGRPPSDSELADHTGLSVRRLEYIRRGQRPVAEGTLIQPGTEEGSGMYSPQAEGLAPDDSAWIELVYSDLGPVDQYILERALGIHGHSPTPPSQVAKELKISPGAVSQRMEKIQAQLDRRDELKML